MYDTNKNYHILAPECSTNKGSADARRNQVIGGGKHENYLKC